MKRLDRLWDIEWTHADSPDEDHKEVGLARFQIRYFMNPASPFAQLIRRMEPGDSVYYVAENTLTKIEAKCYAV